MLSSVGPPRSTECWTSAVPSKAVFHLLDLVGICSFDLSFLENYGHQKHIWVHLHSVLQQCYQDLDRYCYHQWSVLRTLLLFTGISQHWEWGRILASKEGLFVDVVCVPHEFLQVLGCHPYDKRHPPCLEKYLLFDIENVLGRKWSRREV